MNLSAKYLFSLILSIAALSAVAQNGGENNLSAQINSGSISVIKGEYRLEGIIAPAIVVSSTRGDVNFSSGFDFPIVKTGMDAQLNENWEIKAYPTVVTNKLTISCANTANRSFYIEAFDLLGNKIQIADIQDKTFQDIVNIDLSNLQNTGMYLFVVHSNSSSYSKTFRIVKI